MPDSDAIAMHVMLSSSHSRRSAPRLTRYLMISKWPFSVAECSGVLPLSSFCEMSSPFSIKSFASWTLFGRKCNKFSPCFDILFISALNFINSSTSLMFPPMTAEKIGEYPSSSHSSMLTPKVSHVSRKSASQWEAAKCRTFLFLLSTCVMSHAFPKKYVTI